MTIALYVSVFTAADQKSSSEIVQKKYTINQISEVFQWTTTEEYIYGSYYLQVSLWLSVRAMSTIVNHR